MRRMIGAAVICVAVAGCGSSKKADPVASAKTKSKSALDSYFTALTNLEGAKACGLMSPAYRATQGTTYQGRKLDCAGALDLVARKSPSSLKIVGTTAHPKLVSATADSAIYTVSFKGSTDARYTLAKIDGSWLISAIK